MTPPPTTTRRRRRRRRSRASCGASCRRSGRRQRWPTHRDQLELVAGRRVAEQHRGGGVLELQLGDPLALDERAAVGAVDEPPAVGTRLHQRVLAGDAGVVDGRPRGRARGRSAPGRECRSEGPRCGSAPAGRDRRRGCRARPASWAARSRPGPRVVRRPRSPANRDGRRAGAAPASVTCAVAPPSVRPKRTIVVPAARVIWVTFSPLTQVPWVLPRSTTSQPSPTGAELRVVARHGGRVQHEVGAGLAPDLEHPRLVVRRRLAADLDRDGAHA